MEKENYFWVTVYSKDFKTCFVRTYWAQGYRFIEDISGLKEFFFVWPDTIAFVENGFAITTKNFNAEDLFTYRMSWEEFEKKFNYEQEFQRILQ